MPHSNPPLADTFLNGFAIIPEPNLERVGGATALLPPTVPMPVHMHV